MDRMNSMTTATHGAMQCPGKGLIRPKKRSLGHEATTLSRLSNLSLRPLKTCRATMQCKVLTCLAHFAQQNITHTMQHVIFAFFLLLLQVWFWKGSAFCYKVSWQRESVGVCSLHNSYQNLCYQLIVLKQLSHSNTNTTFPVKMACLTGDFFKNTPHSEDKYYIPVL